MNAFLLVGAGGALGAMGRYGSGVLITRMMGAIFPYGTLFVNITGSLLMGLFIGAMARFTPVWQADARLFFAVGVLGGFTTFSAFSLDVVLLVERGDTLAAVLYMIVSIIISMIALLGGLLLMRGVAL
ncbi:Fluoride ion transporter CrcB [hydrothermal vent metagenome]|uniref:Fluoride ion transporter CrcB n=1 Tax=hydrothermal vent metagenome TaxID=652676 RepID=A0A3B0TUI5_9ZZZZ